MQTPLITPAMRADVVLARVGLAAGVLRADRVLNKILGRFEIAAVEDELTYADESSYEFDYSAADLEPVH